MAHFAEIDQNNIVLRVLVCDEGSEGQAFLQQLGGTWVQTSYNTAGGQHSLGGTPLRKNFAGIGYSYDPVRDAFIPPKPFDSWGLNETSCLWEAPTTCPGDEVLYYWHEPTLAWVLQDEFQADH